MSDLAIIGAGSWGTALAVVLSPRYESVRLWVREPDLAARIAATRINDLYLDGIELPVNIEPHTSLEPALAGASTVLGVMPSRYAHALYSEMLPFLSPSMRFVSATKGLEQGTLLRVSEVIQAVIRPKFEPRVAVLSGPTFAKEIARGEPAAVVISSEDRTLAAEIQREFHGPSFRLYTNSDPIGVEIGAALKNVIAIAAGVCQGMGLGNNTSAALITRGLAEITRLAVAMGGQPKTLAGLAGLGDLVLTCTGGLSRNRTVGIELARGRSVGEIVSSMIMVAEGVDTTSAAVALGQRYSVDLPIAAQMNRILNHGLDPRAAVRKLMERSPKEE